MRDPAANPAFSPLPPDAMLLLRRASSPPRLIAHLVLVHETALQLIKRMDRAFPGLTYDREAVLFGAAIHDIGKTVCTRELVESGGRNHLDCGLELLRKYGVPASLSRFAFTHAGWASTPDLTLEDLLVALADKCWKDKRIEALETKTIGLLVFATGRPAWECHAKLDEILTGLGHGASARIAWQASFRPQNSIEGKARGTA